MAKEAIICIVALILIICGNNISNSYTEKSVEDITKQLDELKNMMEDSNREEELSKINEIIENWNKRNSKLAYFIEHDELEKVDTSLVEIKGNIDVEEKNNALVEIDKCSYILYHIENKYLFKLENIF